MAARRVALVIGVAVLVFVLDRITKGAVVASLPLGASREVIGDVVRITHVRNSGAAFGLLPERTTLLSILSVFAVLAIVYYYRKIALNSPLVAGTLGMQLGGAIGNLVDRLGQGYVVDFVDVGIGNVRYWSFNVADSSIVVGIALVTILLYLEEKKVERRPA
ncbi:MAG: signal peptidase II [Chloroflexi bacterium]|nr:signal peptidase II [Chloroflexota bacterium]